MAKYGRPCKEINQNLFENLCALHCTMAEVCACLEVTEKTLQGWCKRTYGMTFSQISKIKANKGNMSIRRAQMKLAERNSNMAIWLGKVYLGQSEYEKPEENEDDGFIEAINTAAGELNWDK